MAEGFSKIPSTTPLLHESLKELLDILQLPTDDENVNRTGQNERAPLIPKNETTVHVDDSDDDFEDIIQAEKGPIAVQHDHKRSVTNAGTFFHLCKAYFSPALLTMPKAMSHLGLVPGIIGIFIFGTLFTYCIHVLLEVNRAIVNRVALDRHIRELKDAVLKLERLKVLHELYSGTVNSVPEDNSRIDTSNVNQNSALEDDRGKDASTSNRETKNTEKSTKNWKLRFAPDFEQGEPSSSQGPNESLASSYETVPENSDDPPSNKSDNNKKDEIPLEEQRYIVEIIQHYENFRKLPPVRTLHYPKLVELSFHYGMKENKWAAKPMKLAVQYLMYLTHYGCCCVCFLFTAESLGELATKGPLTHSGSFEMVSYAIPFVICISFLPTGHEMTAVNTIAFLLQFCGVCMMGYYFFIGEHTDHTELNLYSAPAETWYLYFGLIFYAFEGTGVSLHVESHMARKQDFLGWKGILSRSMYITIPVYAIVGGLGYWKYGNDVHTSVSFNLPEEHIPDLIQILIGMGVLLTFPFHLSFILNPLKKLILDDSLTGTRYQILDVMLRAMFVVSTYIVSALVPYLELQLTVIGATASSFLVLFMPAFMSLNSYIHLPDLHYGKCRLLFHCFLMIIGCAGAGLTTFMNFKNAHLYYPNSTIFG